MHQIEGVIDLFERHGVGDEIVDIDLALHVPVDDFWNVGAASGAAEGRSLPHAPSDQLERTRRDLLPCPGDTDDHAHAPPLMTAFERLTHGLYVADAFEAV